MPAHLPTYDAIARSGEEDEGSSNTLGRPSDICDYCASGPGVHVYMSLRSIARALRTGWQRAVSACILLPEPIDVSLDCGPDPTRA